MARLSRTRRQSVGILIGMALTLVFVVTVWLNVFRGMNGLIDFVMWGVAIISACTCIVLLTLGVIGMVSVAVSLWKEDR